MNPHDPSWPVRPEERIRKKRAEAERLRGFTPEATLRAGFDLMEFGQALGAAVAHEKRR